MPNSIKLSKEKQDIMTDAIKDFFQKERDENLGDLSSYLILDFIIKELGPEFYNQGIEDAYSYMMDRSQDLLELQRHKK